ncbi:MAG: transcriptional regulator with XRE-family HTH domain [Lentisphaeria bacterium]|jgi:transcriptional regulator with XRE-family HTH domain
MNSALRQQDNCRSYSLNGGGAGAFIKPEPARSWRTPNELVKRSEQYSARLDWPGNNLGVYSRGLDSSSEPDFASACITGVVLDATDEVGMRYKVGQAIEAGNNLSTYCRRDLEHICGIKSAQFSKIIKGEAWSNIGNLGLWSFATGISLTDLLTLAPMKASPSLCISWFANGRLNHFDHDEFELFTKIICRRMGLRHVPVNVVGDEALPKPNDKSWQKMYLNDLNAVMGRRLKQLRETLELSHKSFGEILDITPDTVKRRESGKMRINGGLFSAYRLATATNISPLEITKGSVHHKLSCVQQLRHIALLEITQQLDYSNYKQLKDLAISLYKI